ncbi:DUF1631 family protein [Frateuria defendens]|uniref:DUF1631 family protein n=1 Tax=Frateuria defendens TaxID=2219559 RepID=UPI00066FFA97|nr:DUF1631 family protein [Frateuria defendens]
MEVEPASHLETRWPPRARRLLDDVRTLSRRWLHEALRLGLVDFDRRLYEQAERARTHFDQQRFEVVRQRLLREQHGFDRHFVTHVEQAFERLDAPADAPASLAFQPLTLLDPLEHELTGALDQLVSRSEARAGRPLLELGYRLAVLIGAPPLEGEAMPVGPQAMAAAFLKAVRAMGLPGEHELLLLQSVEGQLLHSLAPLYEMLNEHLRSDGILPDLRVFAAPRAVRHGPPAAEPRPEAVHSEPIAVLDSLRELLARQRVGHIEGLPTGRTATAGELQTALGALQRHLGQVGEQVSRELRSAQRLREELLRQLNADRPIGATRTRLTPEHDDTMELVSRLFEQLAGQLPQDGEAQALLGGLQLPVLRMAVADRQFFDQHEHPARQLLGKVTEIAQDWIDDAGSEADRGLRGKLETLVERTHREAPEATLYATLLAEAEQLLADLKRKAQLAERRHVEAMQGRERLEQARQRAAALMAERFARTPPQGLLRTLLERAWSDVLALTLLRHGEDSEIFGLRLTITDQLLGRLPTGDRGKLQSEVEAGLQQIGMHGEEAAQVAQRLLAGREAAAAPSATQLAMRLKQHQRLGEQAGESATATPPAPASHTATAGDATTAGSDASAAPPDVTDAMAAPLRALHERLRTLPFGSWFEFAEAAGRPASRRKLAWYSPVSGNSLFVTRRGQRAEELSLAGLARALDEGRIRELPARGPDSLLDRAWHALTGSLRQAARPATGARP